ncbi:MAG: RNA polymerase sigma factor [Planctomycetota bacterium]
MSTPDDRSLRESVLSARDGDHAAIQHLIAQHLPPLEAFLRLRAGAELRRRESVSDLVQSVCREALQDIAEIDYRGDAEFRNWLFLLATRKILDRHKFYGRDRRDVRREQHLTSGHGAAELLRCYGAIASPSRIASAREELERLELAVGELPELQRDAVAYVKLLGLPYEQVAQRMGRSESAVRGLVARGLALVAHRLRISD